MMTVINLVRENARREGLEMMPGVGAAKKSVPEKCAS
jgi:hypothetical protein